MYKVQRLDKGSVKWRTIYKMEDSLRAEAAADDLFSDRHDTAQFRVFDASKRVVTYEGGHRKMSSPIADPLPEVPRREKCEVEGDRHLRPCTTLYEAMIGENPHKRARGGLYLLAFTNTKTWEPSRSFAVLKSGEHQEKGIILNFCPFCGAQIDLAVGNEDT